MAVLSTTSTIFGLAEKLIQYTIKTVRGVKGMVDEHKIKQDLEDSLKDAERAFRARVPKGKVIPTDILNAFFDSPAMESQYQELLQGNEPDLNILEAAFYEAGYTQESTPDFNPRLAIAEFFDEFIESAGRKASFIKVITSRLLSEGYKGRYLEQLVEAHENLSFAGVPDAYGQNVVKLEDIFITLQASHRIPEVDILADEGGLSALIVDQRRPPRDVPMRESIEILSVMDALKEHDKLMVLGAPGSGKTTFMKYLALTFAQNLSSERLELDEERLPILITLQDIAEELSKKTIAEVLSEHIKTQLQLEMPDGYFYPYLEAGRCIVLFDGLDEVANIKQRGEVAEAVKLFANLYKENRYIITSRIAGYREIQQLPEDHFAHFTIRDFDDDQIEEFARNWCQVRYPLVEANKQADDLIQAIERNPKVKQLATNPLMLTIIAIVHRSSAELPNERIKLYDRCTDALLYSWQREHGRPTLTDIHGKEIPDGEVRRRLEQLAYWIHSELPATAQGQTHVKYMRLKSQLAEQLIDRKKIDPDEAEDEAKHFLEYIRQTTGVLLERGTELYAFVHLTFQEYFAAYDIYRRCRGDVEKVWEEISPNLHDSHWQEVILLLIAKLNGEYDEIGEELIQKILNAETPYDDLLQRNLFLAAACLADDVTAEVETYEPILDKIIDGVFHSPYRVQWEYAIDILKDLANSHYKNYVMDKFPDVLSNDDSSVRWRAAYALDRIGQANECAIKKLVGLLDDEDSSVRLRSAFTLGAIGPVDERVIGTEKMAEFLFGEDASVREIMLDAFGSIGQADECAIEKMLGLLSDEDSAVRGNAIFAIGNISQADERIIEKMLGLFSDEDSYVRGSAAYAIGRIGQADERIIEKMLGLLSDEDSYVRESAAYAIGRIGQADEHIIEKMLGLLSDEDSDMRWSAAYAIGRIGQADEHIIEKMLGLLSDEDSDMRALATYSLVKIGILNDSVLGFLESICEDYKKYDNLVLDQEREGYLIHIYDWAFRALWQHAPSRIEEKGD